jgi:hypothetical protein
MALLGQQTTLVPTNDREKVVGKGDEMRDKPEREAGAESSEKTYVKSLVASIKKDEGKWEPQYKRMRKNLAFVASLQHPGQKRIDENRYVVNFVNRLVAMKVSTLYARNPKAIATRRKRRDFRLWSGKQEDLMQAGMAVQSALQMGTMPPQQAWALLQDWEKGIERREFIKNIGETFEIVYQYQIDTQEPEFKSQMKQLVWRTCVCGVGYVRVNLCREYENELTTSETRTNIEDRLKAAQGILEKLQKGNVQDSDSAHERLRILVESLDHDSKSYSGDLKERLVFDFPNSTSIIPDSHCRSLRDFTGCHRLAEAFVYPIDYVNDFFSVDIKASAGVVHYNKSGQEYSAKNDPKVTKEKIHIKVYEVWDRDTKTNCIVCDGWDQYVRKPQPLDPCTRRFWPVFALTFNHVETEGECDASPFPPSDVDLMKSAQIEWNRSRNELAKHRRANKPQYIYQKGALSNEDKDNLVGAESSEAIELNSVDPDVSKIIQPLQKLPIDPALYDTNPLKEDSLVATGAQEANMGPAQPNVTATVGTIAEQSRNTVSASNVDDLDDMLSAMAEAGGEMIFRGFDRETIIKIAGDGGIWPLSNTEDFVDELYLQIQAASSGRPNKAIDSANMERLGPLIMQAAQMPPQMQKTIQALIREVVKRLDDQLDPNEFFPDPIPLLMQSPQTGQQPMGASTPPQGPQQPLQPTPNGVAVPMVAA